MQNVNVPDFNENAAVPVFGFSHNPVDPRAFVITRRLDDKEPYPVGEYTVLDSDEDIRLAEKKVMNLVSLLNGRKKLMQLGHETKSRILYNIVTPKDENGFARVIFYRLGEEGNSVENAMLQIKGEENESEIIV